MSLLNRLRVHPRRRLTFRPVLELLESRFAPATLVDASTVTYQDVDSDQVTVSLTGGLLTSSNANLVFHFNTGSVNGDNSARQQLQVIDLTQLGSAASGASLTVTAVRGPVGNGLANIGRIDATGLDLSTVEISGDLGKILAGSGTAGTTGLATLSVQSMGKLGAATQPPGSDIASVIHGHVGTVSVQADITGSSLSIVGGAQASLDSLSITGSLIGSASSRSGAILVDGTLGTLTIGRDLSGGSVSGTVSADRTGYIEADRISTVTISGSIRSGMNHGTGTLTRSGSLRARHDLGTLTVRGNLSGSAAVPVVISAAGFPTATDDVAIRSLTVQGSATFANVLAGYDAAGNPIDGSAQVASVTVNGAWTASNLVAGTLAGSDGVFGTADDTPISDNIPGVLSTLSSVTIKGRAEGTTATGQHFGFVAELVGSLSVSGQAIPLQAGPFNDNRVIGKSGNLTVRESAPFVAYWRFEEGTADVAATGTGTILDSSGHGLNGSPINGPIYRSNVPVNPIPQTGAANTLSMDFDGLTQRVFIADDPHFQLTNSLTLEAYIFVRSLPPSYASGGNAQIIFRGDSRPGLDPYFLSIQGDQIAFSIQDAQNNNGALLTPLPALSQWIHVAATLDDVTGTIALYVNGVQAVSAITSVRPFAVLDVTQCPGLGIADVQADGASEFFDGLIDEVRISNQALGSAQFLNGAPPANSAHAVPRIFATTGSDTAVVIAPPSLEFAASIESLITAKLMTASPVAAEFPPKAHELAPVGNSPLDRVGSALPTGRPSSLIAPEFFFHRPSIRPSAWDELSTAALPMQG